MPTYSVTVVVIDGLWMVDVCAAVRESSDRAYLSILPVNDLSWLTP